MKLYEYTHILTCVDRVGSIDRHLSMNYVSKKNPPCLRDKTIFIYTKDIGAAVSFCLKCLQISSRSDLISDLKIPSEMEVALRYKLLTLLTLFTLLTLLTLFT